MGRCCKRHKIVNQTDFHTIQYRYQIRKFIATDSRNEHSAMAENNHCSRWIISSSSLQAIPVYMIIFTWCLIEIKQYSSLGAR